MGCGESSIFYFQCKIWIPPQLKSRRGRKKLKINNPKIWQPCLPQSYVSEIFTPLIEAHPFGVHPFPRHQAQIHYPTTLLFLTRPRWCASEIRPSIYGRTRHAELVFLFDHSSALTSIPSLSLRRTRKLSLRRNL